MNPNQCAEHVLPVVDRAVVHSECVTAASAARNSVALLFLEVQKDEPDWSLVRRHIDALRQQLAVVQNGAVVLSEGPEMAQLLEDTIAMINGRRS